MSSPAQPERQRQRYKDNFRLVAGCVPYKLKNSAGNDDDNLETRLQVLMISSPDRDDLVFPKGGWEFGETEVEAACREAMEEAGVKGIIQGKLGVWEFRSKSSQISSSLEGSCRGSMFALEVTEELPSWSEKDIHKRRWLSVEEARERCRYDWMREALKSFLDFLSGEAEFPVLEMPEPENSLSTLSPVKRSAFENPINAL